MQPIIKWPGGKASEIQYFKDIIPEYDRYIEPFCGGAAVYFYLEPSKAIINDISENLTNFYRLIKDENLQLKSDMYNLNTMWESLKIKANNYIPFLTKLFIEYKNNHIEKQQVCVELAKVVNLLLQSEKINIIDLKILNEEINRMLEDKFFRTYKNEIKNKKELSIQDLECNLLTGIVSGIYMAVRCSFNQLEKESSLTENLIVRKTAFFYFVREFCYGSMFRYNKKGDFNIPYGGIGYNDKDYKKKLDIIYDRKTIALLRNTTITCGDFEKIILAAEKEDFIFLDPPYDTDFSDYENKSFDKDDQIRLQKALQKTKAKFILIIKNTPFIFSLYNKGCFKINSFDNTYSYCVKNRNNRNVKHLIITNY